MNYNITKDCIPLTLSSEIAYLRKFKLVIMVTYKYTYAKDAIRKLNIRKLLFSIHHDEYAMHYINCIANVFVK